MGDRKSGPVHRYGTSVSLTQVVELPLLAPSFVPGKKGYERAWQCLHAWDVARSKERCQQGYASWTMLFSWVPPVHIQAEEYESKKPAFPPSLVPPENIRSLPLECYVTTRPDMWIPCLGESDVPMANTLIPDQASETWKEQYSALLEYVGLATIASPRLQTFDRCDPSLAQYDTPAPCTAGTFVHVQMRGMFPPALARAVIHTLNTWLEHQKGPSVTPARIGSWAAVSLTGFPDTSIAWRSRYPGLGLALGSGHSLNGTQPASPSPPARKARGKGIVRRGESEHGMLRTGENGWNAIVLHPPACNPGIHRRGTLFVESLELDTRN